jgi:hypothetical protein
MPLELKLWNERQLECAALFFKILRLERWEAELKRQPRAAEKLGTLLRSRKCSPSLVLTSAAEAVVL